MFSKYKVSLRRLLRMSAMRQAMKMSGVFVAVVILTAFVAANLIHGSFESQVESDLKLRFDQVARDVDQNGFRRGRHPITPYSAVFFRSPETDSDRYLPAEFFMRNGLTDDEIWEEDDSWEDRMEQVGLDGRWSFYSGAVAGGQLVVGINLTRWHQLLDFMSSSFLFIGGLVAILTLAFGFMSGIQAQKRISRFTDVLEKVSGGDLSARIGPDDKKDDLTIFARHIDTSLAQLETLVNQSRTFATNIAHDLKTPLLRLRIRLERIVGQVGDAAEVQGAVEQLDQIVAILEAFLRIARIDSGAGRSRFAEVNLEDIAREMAEIYVPLAEDEGRQLNLQLSGPSLVMGDAVLLQQFLANLIENALRHTEQGTDITVHAGTKGFGVSDQGPGIPVEQYADVLKPLFRLDHSRNSPGEGLGLALVNSIAKLHRAKLHLSGNPQTGRGLFVRICF